MIDIYINGKITKTQAISLHQLVKDYQKPFDIIIYNGFQTTKDFALRPNDTIHLIKKGDLPNQDELENMLSARHTPSIHHQIKQGRVAIAGLGGLGSQIAVMLARTGVGYLKLIDFDIVEPSNLNRQHYFISHLGHPKTTALKQQLLDINPYINIQTEDVRITETNIHNYFNDVDFVCEAFDHPQSKALLINYLLQHKPAITTVAASGMAGYKSSNLIKTTRPMKRLYLCGDTETEAKPGYGLMAPRVQICAAHQANMILRLLLNINDI